MLKSNSKQLPADGKVNAKQLQVMQMFDWLGSWKGIEKVFNKDENNSFNFKKMCSYPYILCYETEVASLFNTWLVSGFE